MPNTARVAVLHLLACLADVPVETSLSVVRERVRDDVVVAVFGGDPGFGDGRDEHRFRIDDHWPLRK